jgi:hypothetical protein
MNPALTTSAIPATSSFGQVHQHGARLVEDADQVLAGLGVDTGLAADGRVDHPEQGGRHVDQPDAPHPGGRDETGQVGDRAAAEPDDRAPPVQADAAEDLPAEAGDGQRLAVLRVRDLDPVRFDPGFGEFRADRLRGAGERGWVDQRDLRRVAQHLRQLAEQAAADDHLVRVSGPDLDAGRFGHARPSARAGPGPGSGYSASAAVMASTTSPGVR